MRLGEQAQAAHRAAARMVERLRAQGIRDERVLDAMAMQIILGSAKSCGIDVKG